MNNFEPKPEQELSTVEIVGTLQDFLSEEDAEFMTDMEPDEAIGYLFTILLEQGIEDPEAFLKEKGILE